MPCLHCKNKCNGSLCKDCQEIFKLSKTRPCTKCKKILDFNQFSKRKKSMFGIEAQCKLCERNPIITSTAKNKKFSDNPKSIHWSNRNEKSPNEYAISSHFKAWFNCNICKHEFQSALNHVTGKGRWCPYCAKNTKLCENNDCEICYNKSFASFEKSKNWSSRNDKSPRDYALNSTYKVWFKCNKCKHEFDSTLNNVTNNRSWCPYCVTNTKLCEKNDCEICYKKSFASSEKSKNWSNRNKNSPREYAISSNYRFWFDCEKCKHSFESELSSVTRGNWCPNCKHKTELIIKNWLIEMFNNDDIKTQFTIDECVNIRKLPFDFLIKSIKVILELDGIQHFEIVKHWKNCPIENLKRDIYKMECAEKAGYKVIRICQDDVWKNQEFYKQILTDLLKNPSQLEQFTFVSKDETLYMNHKDELSISVIEQIIVSKSQIPILCN